MNTSSNRPTSILRFLLCAIFILSLLLTGCAPTPAVKPAEATQVPSDTPQPTSTTTASPTPTETATMTPNPTVTSTPDKTATIAAAKTSTAVALDELIRPELEKMGGIPEEGHVVWSNPRPISIQTNTYGEIRYYGLDNLENASDFILHTKVSWNTTTGFAGCGIAFRSEEDFLNGAHYYFMMVRVMYAPYWVLSYDKFNRVEYVLTGDPVWTGAIKDTNDSSNEIFLVAQGQNILTYINGEKQRLAEDIKLKDGKIAFSAVQESGTTKCTFEDSWVWAYNKK